MSAIYALLAVMLLLGALLATVAISRKRDDADNEWEELQALHDQQQQERERRHRERMESAIILGEDKP